MLLREELVEQLVYGSYVSWDSFNSSVYDLVNKHGWETYVRPHYVRNGTGSRSSLALVGWYVYLVQKENSMLGRIEIPPSTVRTYEEMLDGTGCFMGVAHHFDLDFMIQKKFKHHPKKNPDRSSLLVEVEEVKSVRFELDLESLNNFTVEDLMQLILMKQQSYPKSKTKKALPMAEIIKLSEVA